MLFVPISVAGTLGARADAPAFDVSPAPSLPRVARAAGVAVGQVQLATEPGRSAVRRTVDVPLTTEPPPRRGSDASRAADSPVTADRGRPVPTITAAGPAARASSAAAASPSASPPISVPPISLTLPLDLVPGLKSLAARLGSEQGEASWFDAPDGTCAHQTLPFGTVVTVTRVSDGASTTCLVDDRGPFITGRVIDLSYDVFEQLAHPGAGVIEVVIEW
jgi:hypothetical protein